MEVIYLDFHSRTSVELTKVLLREHWKLSPQLLGAGPGYESMIKDGAGGLVIGDRAIGLEKKFHYVYDLGEEWLTFSGLPFVFAAWVSNRPLRGDFIEAFNAAMERGVAEVPQLMYLLPSPSSNFDLKTYFTRHISYKLDAEKRKALGMFLQKLNTPLPEGLFEGLSRFAGLRV